MESADISDTNCPDCGRPMLQRHSRNVGPYLGCSGYPDCKVTMVFNADGKPVRSSRPSDQVCDKCGKPMTLRQGRSKWFLACSSYPLCRNTRIFPEEPTA